MKRLLLLLFCPCLVLAQVLTEPDLTRAQQERMNRVLIQAVNDEQAALGAVLAIPEGDRDPVLWRWLGDQLADKEQWAPAIEAYTKALEALPTYRDVLLNLARAALGSDQSSAAVPLLQTAMREGLVDAQVLEALGLLAESAEDLLLAEQAYRQTLLLRTDAHNAREGLARIFIGQRRYGEAESLIQLLMRQSPRRPGLWRLYADLAQAQEDTDTAARRLETAIRLGVAESTDHKRLMELYMVLDRPLEVLRLRDAYAHLLREDPALTLRLSEGLLSLGHIESARPLLRELPAELRREDDVLRRQRIEAQLLLLDEKPLEAARLLEQALERHPLDTGLLRLSGEAWLQAGRPGDAALAFARLSRQPGQQAQGLWLQGIAEARAGNPSRAIELLEAARQIEDLPGLRRSLEQLRRLAEL